VAAAIVCLQVGALEAQREPAVSRIAGDPRHHDLAPGDSAVSRLVLQGSTGALVDPTRRKDLRAISDDPDVVRVVVREGKLVVYALRRGQARVKVAAGDVAGWLLVTVQDRASKAVGPTPAAPPSPTAAPPVPTEVPAGSAVTGIRAGDSLVTLLPGEAERLNVIPLGPGGTPVRAPLRFASYNRDAADVDSITGDVIARAPGRAIIGVEATGTLIRTVIEVRVVEGELGVAPDTLHLTVATRDTVRVVVPSQGGRPYHGRVDWSSSVDSVLRVDPATGEVQGRAPGLAEVRARAAGREIRSVAQVYRRPAWIHAPAYQDSVLTVPLGATRPAFLAALGEKKDTLYALPARWSFGDSGIAVYDPGRGVIVGRRVGLTRLTAQPRLQGSMADTMSWTVRVIGGAISAGPARRGYRVGDRDTLRAVLRDSLGAPTQDRIEAVWQSGQASVLRLVEPAVLEAMAPGRTTVTGRSLWDSTVTITAFVAPDLVFSVSGVAAGGRRVAGIYGYDFRNRAARSLTGNVAVDADPAVSPDRTRLAFIRVGERGRGDLWVVDVAGGGEMNLTSDTLRESRPAWSPDGRRVYYIAQKGKLPRVFSVELAGGPPRAVSDSLRSVQDFALSPDGKHLVLAVVRGESVDLLAADLTGDGALARAPEPLLAAKGMDQFRPRFSARDGALYFVRRARGGKRESLLMRYRWGASAPETLFRLSENVLDYTVSPDGTRLVALAARKDPRIKEPRKGLYELDPRTGAVSALLYEDATGETGTPVFTP